MRHEVWTTRIGALLDGSCACTSQEDCVYEDGSHLELVSWDLRCYSSLFAAVGRDEVGDSGTWAYIRSLIL